jgi:hypothetical protein
MNEAIEGRPRKSRRNNANKRKEASNPIPCPDCDFNTNNKSMFLIGNQKS